MPIISEIPIYRLSIIFHRYIAHGYFPPTRKIQDSYKSNKHFWHTPTHPKLKKKVFFFNFFLNISLRFTAVFLASQDAIEVMYVSEWVSQWVDVCWLDCRVRKSKNFPDSQIFHAKTFRIRRVNRDTFAFATKVRKTREFRMCIMSNWMESELFGDFLD